jgi:hypothetical protein
MQEIQILIHRPSSYLSPVKKKLGRTSRLVVNTHDHLVAVNVYVALHQRERLVQNVVAGANEVDIED